MLKGDRGVVDLNDDVGLLEHLALYHKLNLKVGKSTSSLRSHGIFRKQFIRFKKSNFV